MGPRVTFSSFVRGGHGKFALLAAFAWVPVFALMTASGEATLRLQPHLIAFKESLTGQRDEHWRDTLAAVTKELRPRPRLVRDAGGNLFENVGAVARDAGVEEAKPAAAGTATEVRGDAQPRQAHA